MAHRSDLPARGESATRYAPWALVLMSLHVAANAQSAVNGTVRILEPFHPPMLVHASRPAGGAFNRVAGRPGARYAVVFLPLSASAPIRLRITQQDPNQAVRLFALDRWPEALAHSWLAIPTRVSARAPGRGMQRSAALSLPATSQYAGAFLLFEQSVAPGRRASPFWIEAVPAEDMSDDRDDWISTTRGASPYPSPPASPLLSGRSGPIRSDVDFIELPFDGDTSPNAVPETWYPGLQPVARP